MASNAEMPGRAPAEELGKENTIVGLQTSLPTVTRLLGILTDVTKYDNNMCFWSRSTMCHCTTFGVDHSYATRKQ